MGYSDKFFRALGVNPNSKGEISGFSKKSGVSVKSLRYYNDHNLVPSGQELDRVLSASGVSVELLKIKMGRLDERLLEKMIERSDDIIPFLEDGEKTLINQFLESPDFSTSLGEAYRGDCLELLKRVESDSIDVVFADPPFNLSKIYPSGMDDNLKVENYIKWCGDWIEECTRVLKPGGSFFLWNLPRWNVELSRLLGNQLSFKHWISVDIKYSLPIKGRLYPSHYSLLYYVKGEKAKVFKPDRLPMQTCPVCHGDLKDYGGYKNKMNPSGISLTDVWWDVSPVRHSKYKKREGSNELPLKLMDRIIEMSSEKDDVILDPFGGSGTTFVASEIKGRRWIGFELGPLDVIEKRFENLIEEEEYLESIRSNLNSLFPEDLKKKREAAGLWTDATFSKRNGKDCSCESRKGSGASMELDI